MSLSPSTRPDTPTIPAWSLGDRLRKVRRMLGISQAEMAKQLEINAKTYAAWELDSTAPRNLVAVAKRIEVLSAVPAGWTLGVSDTEVDTARYRIGRSHLALVSDPIGTYAGVPDGYGSSAAEYGYATGENEPINEYANGRTQPISSGMVKNADAA